MASLYVKYPKTCRNKKSSVYVTPPTSITSSSSGSLSSSDGIKSSSSVSQSKRKHHLCIHQTHIRGHKVSIALPKRKKLKLKKSPPSTSTSSDSEMYKVNECWPFIINNNTQDEIDRNDVYSTCKIAIKLTLILFGRVAVNFLKSYAINFKALIKFCEILW
jgi:hypothetical protein